MARSGPPGCPATALRGSRPGPALWRAPGTGRARAAPGHRRCAFARTRGRDARRPARDLPRDDRRDRPEPGSRTRGVDAAGGRPGGGRHGARAHLGRADHGVPGAGASVARDAAPRRRAAARPRAPAGIALRRDPSKLRGARARGALARAPARAHAGRRARPGYATAAGDARARVERGRRPRPRRPARGAEQPVGQRHRQLLPRAAAEHPRDPPGPRRGHARRARLRGRGPQGIASTRWC